MSQPCYASCFVPSNLGTAQYDVTSLMATPNGHRVQIPFRVLPYSLVHSQSEAKKEHS